jgi:hypothetical protein
VREDRRDPQRRVRGILGGVVAGSDHRRPGEGARDVRWRVSQGEPAPLEARRRLRSAGDAVDPPRRHRQAGRLPLTHQGGPRSLVPPLDGGGVAVVRARADGEQRSAVRPLHLRNDREAQGDRARNGRILDRRLRNDTLGLRPETRGRVLVHGGHRLGHRPLVRRLRAARRGSDRRDLRGSARLAGPRPLLVDLRALRGHRLLHGADRDPRVHEVGRLLARRPRSFGAAAARNRRRADQPRSVDLVPAAAARSSIRGGRRRRGTSSSRPCPA